MRRLKSSAPACTAGPVVLILLLSACAGINGGGEAVQVTRSPSDTSAIAPASELLKWFYSLPAREENRVVSGQEIGSLDAPQGYYDYVMGLHRRIGQKPAMISIDYVGSIHEPSLIDAERKTDILIRHWNEGGLVSVHAHFGNPWNRRGVHDQSREGGSFSDAYTPGTEAYRNLKRDFDLYADQLTRLEKEGVAVLFRPFHEANGGWFWWHTPEAEEFKLLWRYWHQYLTEARNIHNLLFVYSPSPVSTDKLKKQGPDVYYPGDRWVDLTGLDLYRKELDDIPRANYQRMVDLGKPFGFGELGGPFPPTEENKSWDLRRISAAMEKNYPAAVYWFSWSSWSERAVMSLVDLPHAENLFSHPLIMAMEEVDFQTTRISQANPYTEEADSDQKPVLKIGAISRTHGTVLGYPDYFEEGIIRLRDLLGDKAEIIQVRGLPPHRMKSALERLLKEEQVDIIILESADEPADVIQETIRTHSDKEFILPVADEFSGIDNVHTFGINTSGWYYLTGLMAGALTETGRIGFVAPSYDQWNIEHANEFAMGVEESSGGTAEVLFFDSKYDTPPAIRKLLFEQGCDVLNACADGWHDVRQIEEAAAAGHTIYAFSNLLSKDVLPGIIAASQPEDQGLVYHRLISALQNEEKLPSPRWFDIRNGSIRIGSGTPPLDGHVMEILMEKRIPRRGRTTVFDYINTRYNEMLNGRNLPHPERIEGFLPNIRDVSKQ